MIETITIPASEKKRPTSNRFVSRSLGFEVSALPEILFITSYPPRECGIATYSQDLLKALKNKFRDSFSLKVCALEAGVQNYQYPDEVKLTLDTSDSRQYVELAHAINDDSNIQAALIQHEFGLFQNGGAKDFIRFVQRLRKPSVIVFHTVLPNPTEALRENVRAIADVASSIIVMTNNSSLLLQHSYGIPKEMIAVIAHGTHLVLHLDKDYLKAKYGLEGKKVLTTFGLLSSGKGIETTINSLPGIIEENPDVMFLIMGKTHPSVIKSEGEKYRHKLEELVKRLGINDHVKFINQYLPLDELLEYLQLTDIYLFTSRDPDQAVSGTFSYAMSCGCPIISTPFAHALEVLGNDENVFIDFQNSDQLTEKVNRLLSNELLRMSLSAETLQRIVPTAWENAAIEHAILLQKTIWLSNEIESQQMEGNHHFKSKKLSLQFTLPEISLDHVKKLTTDFGIIQFAKINQPDIESGYTLDDNARSLIAFCLHFELTGAMEDVGYIRRYLNFIDFCLQDEGYFLNYIDEQHRFTEQNNTINLADSSGRAIWALGILISKKELLPNDLVITAEDLIKRAIPAILKMHSTRAMAFTIKGLHLYNCDKKSEGTSFLIKMLADRLVQMFRHESEKDWNWFESYMTYANSILPEALLCAWVETNDITYKEIAKTSFDFLLSLTFNGNRIKVISNKNWLHKGRQSSAVTNGGEQPIDVAYSILALSRFYDVFNESKYSRKMAAAFSWFLGNNHLNQIVYNPCTGGCYDGLEETHINLNQGAESTISYLMARLTVEKYCMADNN